MWIEIGNTDQKLVLHAESLPAWGVWIEIKRDREYGVIIQSLPAWGVWIEISPVDEVAVSDIRRSPHGECGLK